MEIRLQRCAVRSWRKEDAGPLVRHANNRKIWRNVRDRFPHPYTREHAEEWIRTASGLDPETQFAIAVEGEAVGAIGFEIGADIHRRTAEIGFWVGEAYWGRGIATEAVRALTDYVFSSFDLVRIQASILEWNPASARVLEKAGYAREARLRRAAFKDGQTIDIFLYASMRQGGEMGEPDRGAAQAGR